MQRGKKFCLGQEHNTDTQPAALHYAELFVSCWDFWYPVQYVTGAVFQAVKPSGLAANR
jgi:hypothetical protein